MRFETGEQLKKFVAGVVVIQIILPFGLISPCPLEGWGIIHFELEQNHLEGSRFKM